MKNMRSVLTDILDKDLSPGEVLRGARIKAGLSQDELAEVAGIQRPNLSALENDRIEMTVKYAMTLGMALDLHPSELLFPHGQIKQTAEMKQIEKRRQAVLKRQTQNKKSK